MEEGLSLPIYLNQESEFYLNTAFKINALKLNLKHRLLEHTKRIYDQCYRCSTEQCLQKARGKLEQYRAVSTAVNQNVQKLEKTFEEEYYLCRDVIFENDIRFCRVEVMNRHYANLIKAVNDSKLHELK